MARDRIHKVVVNALKKEDWDVNRDPLYVPYSSNYDAYEIDLGAEKLIAAEKGNIRIAVEIKEFAGSLSNQFHTALGQFIDYEAAISESSDENDRTLYLAVPDETYEKIIKVPFFVRRIQEHELRFITINLETETIVAWIE